MAPCEKTSSQHQAVRRPATGLNSLAAMVIRQHGQPGPARPPEAPSNQQPVQAQRQTAARVPVPKPWHMTPHGVASFPYFEAGFMTQPFRCEITNLSWFKLSMSSDELT